MPQKKNPDVAELARGKAGRLIGDLTGLLTTLKGAAAGLQPRPAGGQGAGVRRGRHAARCCCRRSPAWSRRCVFDTERLESLAPQGFSLATDVAEWLVRQGVPFRVAHEVAGGLRAQCEARGIELWDLTDEDLAGDLRPPDAGRADGAVRPRLAGLAQRARAAPPRSGSREQLELVRERVAEARRFA